MKSQSSKAVLSWVFLLVSMIYLMVIVGGLTRLTNSGLSMVDWKPLLGVVPPVTQEQWHEVFKKYQNFPEYQKVNNGMSLEDFKYIFYWEYDTECSWPPYRHGFLFPFCFLLPNRPSPRAIRLQTSHSFHPRRSAGLLGWYMVKSGLVNEPHVSHYRLAAHLSLALICLAYLFVLSSEIWPQTWLSKSRFSLPKLSVGIAACVFLQIIFGAFTAGLHAGLMHNTFPDMNGKFLGEGAFILTPTIMNFLDNPVAVQFVHRCLAWFITGLVGLYVFKTFKYSKSALQRASAIFLSCAVLVQFSLGVATLIYSVPISLASLHQAGAVMLFISELFEVIQNRQTN